MPLEQSHEKFARYEREDESARRDAIEASKKEHWIRDAEARACIAAAIAAEIRLAEDGYEHPQITTAIIKAIEKRIRDRAQG